MAKPSENQVASATNPDQAPAPVREVMWNPMPQPGAKRKPPAPANTYVEPCGWMEGYVFEFLAKGYDKLVHVTDFQEQPMNDVRKVRAATVKGERAAYLVPTHKDDPFGIPMNHSRSGATVNLSLVLEPAGLGVPTGFKDRFLVDVVGPDDGSPVGWALKIYMHERLERAEVTRQSGKKKAQ